MSNNKNQSIGFGDLWSIQESLLQSYRTIFITVESVIMAVGTFLLSTENSSVFLSLPILFLGLVLILIWVGVCTARAHAVTFIHWLMQKYEAGEDITCPYSHFRQFQENRMFGQINVMNDKKFKELSKSKTRTRMDIQVPLLFTFMWILLYSIKLFF